MHIIYSREGYSRYCFKLKFSGSEVGMKLRVGCALRREQTNKQPEWDKTKWKKNGRVDRRCATSPFAIMPRSQPTQTRTPDDHAVGTPCALNPPARKTNPPHRVRARAVHDTTLATRACGQTFRTALCWLLERAHRDNFLLLVRCTADRKPYTQATPKYTEDGLSQ